MSNQILEIERCVDEEGPEHFYANLFGWGVKGGFLKNFLFGRPLTNSKDTPNYPEDSGASKVVIYIEDASF